jgi:CheY-like chemotaxis protein
MIYFDIEDTGSGIPPAQIDRIFMPYEQGGDLASRRAGTGLGLAISRQLVQLMGGELCVESEMGRGSSFSFTLMLPITAGTAEPGAPSDRVIIGYHGRRRSVLVVDDNLSNRAVLLHMLRPLGFELAETADGSQTIALALETRPDLILIDLRMPGIDGFTAAQQLRQLPATQGIPLIAVSASVADEQQAHSREMGFDAFLPKPIQWPRLVALLQEQLQLEWVYAETEDAVAVAPEVAGPLVPPPSDELARLYELIRLGNFYGLRERAAHLETLDPALIPFARKLRELAQGYHEQAILALLEPYLDVEARR